jgi:hypothetical protein
MSVSPLDYLRHILDRLSSWIKGYGYEEAA